MHWKKSWSRKHKTEGFRPPFFCQQNKKSNLSVKSPSRYIHLENLTTFTKQKPQKSNDFRGFYGASDLTRTGDLLITSGGTCVLNGSVKCEKLLPCNVFLDFTYCIISEDFLSFCKFVRHLSVNPQSQITPKFTTARIIYSKRNAGICHISRSCIALDFCRMVCYADCGATNNGRRLALSRRGQLLLLPPDFMKGGLPNGYLFRTDSAWYSYRWHYRPVYSGKKEVIAGTLTSTAITSLVCRG